MKKIKNLLILFGLFFIPFLISASPAPDESSFSISVTISGPAPTPTPAILGGGGGGGGGNIIVPFPGPAKIIFKGKAYPGAFVSLLKNGKIASTALAGSSGDFNIILTGISAGTWTFGVYAEDTEKRKSVTVSFVANILGGADTTISGIFISPTISLSGAAARKGDDMDIYGQAYPLSEVNIFVASSQVSVKKILAGADGKWKYVLKTEEMETGIHTVKAKSIGAGGEQSSFSEEMVFKLIDSCQGANLNFDRKVNLVDFSILLYFWEQEKPLNICSDINRDRSVDLTDFSIMMYWWNG